MKAQINSIVKFVTPSLEITYGVVTQLGEFNNDEPAVQVFFGNKSMIISTALLTVINNNFSVNEDYLTVYNEFRLAINKKIDDTNEFISNFAKTIKPRDVYKTFHFKSIYTPSGLVILVGKKWNKPKYVAINGIELSFAEISTLDTIVRGTIGGLQIANTTIKIGEVIGSTCTIREALDYYHNLTKLN